MHSIENGQNILAAQPVDPSTETLLTKSYNFSPQYFRDRTEAFRDIILSDMDYLDVMVHCTTTGEPSYEDQDPDSGLSAHQVELAKAYRGIASDPVDKHNFDSEFIASFLTKLGPTNHLREHSGLDGAFELSHMKRILEIDYAALPESHRTPESRLTEAYLREELALLWSPTSISRAANLPETKQGFLVNNEDPNVFAPDQLETTTAKDRWKMIGARLSSEATELFSEIATSPSATLDVQVEALSRSVDMRLRELRILSGMSTVKDKGAIRDHIKQISDDETERLSKAWKNPAIRAQISSGKLYESVALALTRQDMIHHNNWNQGIRLALPREDTINKTLKPWINRDNVLINLSSDIIVEDSNGNLVRTYQVKAMSTEAYANKMDIRTVEKGKMLYPEQRTGMLFLDSKVTQVS